MLCIYGSFGILHNYINVFHRKLLEHHRVWAFIISGNIAIESRIMSFKKKKITISFLLNFALTKICNWYFFFNLISQNR